MSEQKEAPISEQAETSAEDEPQLIIALSEEEVKARLRFEIKRFKASKEAAVTAVGPFHAMMERAKIEIEHLLLCLPLPNYSNDEGQAYIADRTTITYDAKALDAVCESFPEVKAIIWPHRSQKTSKSLTVR